MNAPVRYSGVLLHPTSLPSPHGIGDLGDEAKEFIDFLFDCHVGIWQMLPLGPAGFGNSPYTARSVFAGNELLISLDQLAIEGYINKAKLVPYPPFNGKAVDFARVHDYKMPLLKEAAKAFLHSPAKEQHALYHDFCITNANWLSDYALYRALCDHYQDWRWYSEWNRDLARRDAEELKRWRECKKEEIAIWQVLQFFFYTQWQRLRLYAHQKNVLLVGDMPMFVSLDSVDAWCNRHYLKIDQEGQPLAVAGVPPDAFSETGQLWGFPVYDWQALQEDDFTWWVRRLEHLFTLVDIVRIDHFRGFDAYWEVRAGELTAQRGSWVQVPGDALFKRLREHFGRLPLIAEDLGVITESVEQLRDSYGFPGMKVAHFAFDVLAWGELDASNPYLPHNYPTCCIAYTGTHDNNTTKGWYAELNEDHKDVVRRYLSCADHEVPWHLARAIMASSARYAIVPMQDLLGLGREGRMNMPGTCGPPNWCWRMGKDDITETVRNTMHSFATLFGRKAGLEEFTFVC